MILYIYIYIKLNRFGCSGAASSTGVYGVSVLRAAGCYREGFLQESGSQFQSLSDDVRFAGLFVEIWAPKPGDVL